MGNSNRSCPFLKINENDNKDLTDSQLITSFFEYLIDKLIEEWNFDFSSREQISNLMVRQYGYMGEIANSRQRHISKMLVGTLNYAFSLVSANLYKFEEENETLIIIRESISIMQDYFRSMKSMYPNALESVDVVDNSIIELFRKPKTSSD